MFNLSGWLYLYFTSKMKVYSLVIPFIWIGNINCNLPGDKLGVAGYIESETHFLRYELYLTLHVGTAISSIFAPFIMVVGFCEDSGWDYLVPICIILELFPSKSINTASSHITIIVLSDMFFSMKLNCSLLPRIKMSITLSI